MPPRNAGRRPPKWTEDVCHLARCMLCTSQNMSQSSGPLPQFLENGLIKALGLLLRLLVLPLQVLGAFLLRLKDIVP